MVAKVSLLPQAVGAPRASGSDEEDKQHGSGVGVVEEVGEVVYKEGGEIIDMKYKVSHFLPVLFPFFFFDTVISLNKKRYLT